jgi:GxxExxY protein
VRAQAQPSLPVYYKGNPVGDYTPDIVFEEVLIVELKCAEHFAGEHVSQCINYLRASGLHLALLVNFQRPKVEWKRIVLGL